MRHTFASGALTAVVETEAGGVLLRELRLGGETLFDGRAEFVSVTLLDLAAREKTVLSGAEGWTSARVEGGAVVLDRPELTLRLDANCETPDVIRWTASFVNRSETASVWSVDYPRLTVRTDPSLECFFPWRSGTVRPGPAPEEAFRRTAAYPRSVCVMQYMAVFRGPRGVYCGLHDAHGAHKILHQEKEAGAEGLSLWAEYLCTDVLSPRNSQTASGELVWQAVEGDWYDAALLYRAFIRANADWIPETGADGRRRAPEWMKNCVLWWVHSCTKPGDEETVLKAAEDLGGDVPTAVHMYQWHKNPFDNDYPHYFPARPWVADSVAALQRAGIRVMPYINGRLWDTRDRGTEDWQFTDVALPAAVKDEKGEFIREKYGSKEADGSEVALAVMCPSTNLWAEKVTSLVHRLLFEYGFDAVYVDQIAAARAFPCCDRTHDHPAGGGDWWVNSYNRLLGRVMAGVPQEKAITTESLAEPFMKYVAGQLSWDAVESFQVPAFTTVYEGLVYTFGRTCSHHNGPVTDDVACVLMAEGYAFGEQLGWIGADAYLNSPYKAFLRAVIRDRYAHREYFTAGSLMRPPKVECALPEIEGETLAGEFHSPAVKACLRRRERDGMRLLAVFNCAGERAEIRLTSPEFPGGEKRLTLDAKSVYTEEF